MSQDFKRCKQISESSVLCLIMYTLQDKPLKRNRGDLLGLKVEIWEVLTDKREPAACIKSLSSSELRAPRCFTFSPEAFKACPLLTAKQEFKTYTFFFLNTTGVGCLSNTFPSLKGYKPNVRFQNNFQCSNQLVSLLGTINQCCQEQDANLWESYTSSPQAAD